MRIHAIRFTCVLVCLSQLAYTPIGEPPDSPTAGQPKTKLQDQAAKYESSAEKLLKAAERLDKRIPALPEAQKAIAAQLVVAKKELAAVKTQAASLWRKTLGQLPDDFKARLKAAQSKHSDVQLEYYWIGRQIKKSRQSETNSLSQTPARSK